jgi:hypothetical protein
MWSRNCLKSWRSDAGLSQRKWNHQPLDFIVKSLCLMSWRPSSLTTTKSCCHEEITKLVYDKPQLNGYLRWSSLSFFN